jgi:hypothetical protein
MGGVEEVGMIRRAVAVVVVVVAGAISLASVGTMRYPSEEARYARSACGRNLAKLVVGADCPPDMNAHFQRETDQDRRMYSCRVVDKSQMQQQGYVAQSYWIGHRVMGEGGRFVDERVASVTCANGKIASVYEVQ